MLPFQVLELLWNVDASILAVWCQCLDSEEKLDASSGASCGQCDMPLFLFQLQYFVWLCHDIGIV